MKKLLIALALLFSSLAIHAQSSWGVTGGKLFNNFYNPEAKINSSSTNQSFSAGVFYQRPLCSHSSLYTSLSYEDKTTDEVEKDRRYNLTTTNLSYITLEVVSYIPIKRFSLGGGIYYSRLLSSSRATFSYTEWPNGFATIPQDAVNYDAGITAGVNYKLTNRLNLYSKLNLGMVQLTTYREGDQPFLTCGMGMPDGDFWYNAQYSDGKLRGFYNRSLTCGLSYEIIQ